VIVAEWKPIDELVAMLGSHAKILLVGCATCVAECAAGGEREVETLAPLLRMALQAQGLPVEIIAKTLERQCEVEFLEELDKLAPEVDAVLSLACGIGVQAVAERFPDLPVYPGVNTTALAIREEPGLWAARCAACGDCVLGKSLMNGPCGGTRKDGKCEVDENTECVWNLIVERARARGALESLLEVHKPKDWSNSGHGGPKRMLREDLRQ
jgi:ferredoxin